MKQTFPAYWFSQLHAMYRDMPAFHAAYILLTITFAGLFHLGFFAILIAAHLGLDFYKYRRALSVSIFRALWGVMRENLIDVTLFFLALSSVIYLNPHLPTIAALTGVRMTHVIVMRGLAVLLPKLTILHHSLRIAFNVHGYLYTPHPRLHSRLSLMDTVCIWTLIFSVVLIVIAPWTLHIDSAMLRDLILSQMAPWLL